MSARYVQGNANLKRALAVATAQAVEYMDMVALASDTVVRATDTVWASAVATPSAPTVADSGIAVGSPLTASPTSVKISYQFPWGEGALSAAGTATPTLHAALVVSGAPLVPPAPAIWTNIYVETSAGSGVYKLWGRTITGATVMVNSYGAGASPAGSPVTSGALQITQFNFAQIFAGVSNQRKLANVARIFGNSQDNTIMVNEGGIFEFDTASASYTRGQYVGPDKDTGNALLNQQVALVAGPALAIGRVAEDSNYNGVVQASTKVMVEIFGTLNPRPADQYSIYSSGGLLT